MHFINPFKGIRPNKDKASSVVIPSTDHLTNDVISKYKKDNPWNFLNVLRPDIGDNNDKKDIFLKAKSQLDSMKNNSILLKDKNKSFYIYKISTKNHSQIGIIGIANILSYDDLHIRGHEEIYIERSQERCDQMLNLNMIQVIQFLKIH